MPAPLVTRDEVLSARILKEVEVKREVEVEGLKSSFYASEIQMDQREKVPVSLAFDHQRGRRLNLSFNR